MPNWVNNSMTVSADYINHIVNSKNNVDFQLTLPIPEELNVTSGGTNNIAVYYYISHKDNMHYSNVATDPEFIRYIHICHMYDLVNDNMTDAEISEKIKNTAKNWQERCFRYINNIKDEDSRENTADALYKEGKILMSNIQKYGAPTWYEWCMNKWGCKWNASESNISFDANTNTYHLNFNTPWSHPFEWLRNLCENHHIPFHLEWLEEQGFRGVFDSDGKTINDIELEPLCCDEEDCEENE